MVPMSRFRALKKLQADRGSTERQANFDKSPLLEVEPETKN